MLALQYGLREVRRHGRRPKTRNCLSREPISYDVPVTPSKDSTPEPADGYAYLTEAEKADAIAAHTKAVAAKSKGSK